MRRLGNKKGFTLVELSLSIAFIGILSITIALIINDAIATYRRGLTLNQINTAGMDLVDDMRAAIQNAPASIANSCGENENENYMGCLQGHVAVLGMADEVRISNKPINAGEKVPVYGAFCTGVYSYIWNSGYFFASDAKVDPNEKAQLEGFDSDFRLLKVKDKNRAVCTEAKGNKFTTGYKLDEDSVAELLNAEDKSGLALYDLSVPVPAISEAKKTAFYSVSFILGTVQGGINVMSSGNFCKAPESNDNATNFDYCAINKFNFAAQANGG